MAQRRFYDKAQIELGLLPREAEVVLGTAPVLKRWNGSAWVQATVKHGAGWPTITFGTL